MMVAGGIEMSAFAEKGWIYVTSYNTWPSRGGVGGHTSLEKALSVNLASFR